MSIQSLYLLCKKVGLSYTEYELYRMSGERLAGIENTAKTLQERGDNK